MEDEEYRTKPYKGYVGVFDVDWDTGFVSGRIAGMRDQVTFQTSSRRGIDEEFHKSVDDYLAFCEERGEEPERPN